MSTENTMPLDEAALADWCRRAAAGDQDALAGLLCAHHARLLGLARRKVGVDWHGKIDPEDLLQETYVDVFRAIAEFTYSDVDSFYHWATRILDHRFIDHVRHWRRQKRAAAREVQTPAGATSSVQPLLERCLANSGSPSVALRREDAVAALMTCIARLPVDYRVVVQRWYLQQEPLAAIAADLGRSEDALRRLAGRAVARLTECLGRASRYITTQG